MKSKFLLLSLLLTLNFSFVSTTSFSQDEGDKIESAVIDTKDVATDESTLHPAVAVDVSDDGPTVDETIGTFDRFLEWVKGNEKITDVDGLQALAAIIFGLLSSLLLYLTHWIKVWPSWWDDTTTKYIAAGLAVALPFILGRADGLSFSEIMTFVEGLGLWGIVYNLILKRFGKTKEITPVATVFKQK